MATCETFEPLILDKAASALSAEDATAVDAHLQTCSRCRSWLSACVDAVGAASLPDPTDAELSLLAALPSRAVAARRAQRIVPSRWRSAAAFAAVAAALLLAVSARWSAPRVPAKAVPAMAMESASQLADPLDDQTSAAALAEEDDWGTALAFDTE